MAKKKKRKLTKAHIAKMQAGRKKGKRRGKKTSKRSATILHSSAVTKELIIKPA